MPTARLTLSVPDELQEVFIAELAEMDFASFEQQDERLVAYIAADQWDDVRREHLERLLLAFGSGFLLEEEILPDENWNARWEASVRPVRVGRLLVRPPWSKESHPGMIVIEIEPKMSFGTGSHASTRLALGFVSELVRGGEHVLDAGCGSGILAIAALILGAERAVAFDIDPWAVANAEENAAHNGVSNVLTVLEGGMEDLPPGYFDLICANINRNVLIEMLPALEARLSRGGSIILSGLLEEDAPLMRQVAAEVGLDSVAERRDEEWWSTVLQRPTSTTA